MQQEEYPIKDAENYDPASENIKNWFEANKELLISRNQQGSENFRTENNFLFPYIEKEVDWTQHKTYKFKDGREVAEFPVLSEKIPIPGFLVDSVDDKSKIKIKQSVLFVKKLEDTNYSPLLVRFYSLQENIDQVSYNHIPKDWNGIIEAFGMNDGHYITFNFKDGKMVSYSKILANEAKSLKLRHENKSSTCYTYLVENPYHMVCIGGDCVTHHQGYSVRTVCITYQPSGPGGSGPGGDSFCEEFDCYAFPGTGGSEEITYKIENKVKDPCISAQVNLAVNADFKNKITQLVWDAFGESENFNIEIEDVDYLPDSTDGEAWAQPQGDGLLFIIELNSNILSNSSKEYVMATVFHELLHAYLGYLNIDSSGNGSQHTTMANDYLIHLSTALQDHFNINPTEATHLSWGGLHETSKWESLSGTEKNQILETNSNYRSAQKGNPC